MTRPVEDLLARAKIRLLQEHPFVGQLALGMPFVILENDNEMGLGTAGTDGRHVWFNRGFIQKLTDDELLFLVAHEVCHPMFEHCTRRRGREPNRWNVAADVVINHMLIEDRIGSMIKGGVHLPDYFQKGNGRTEVIYDLLEDKVQYIQSAGSGCGGDGNDSDDPNNKGKGIASLDSMSDASPNGDQSQEAEFEADMKIRVAAAAQAAKAAGKLSANQARFVEEILNPKVDWREVLARFVVKCRDDQRTWARPNRRFASQGLVVPSRSGEQMGELVVAIDTSGSIGAKELSQFAAEIKAICQDARPVTLHVVYFDHAVCHHDKFGREDEVKIEPHGGGGTAFSPIFRFIEDNAIEPVATVVLTDLCCSDFGPAPDYPVLWVSTHPGTAPWGEITFM